MEINKFWKEAVSYEKYLKETQESIDHPKNKEEEAFGEYYELGLQRMKHVTKTYKPIQKQLDKLKDKQFTGKVLIITEGWCGDASQTVPIITEFFGEENVRISHRDQEPSLIDDFLTNGGKSIPIVLLLDNEYNVINKWGPRPKYGNELFAKYKSEKEDYSKEQFHNDLQVYYSKNKGEDTVDELLALI